MKTIWEQRASTILFNVLTSLGRSGTVLIPANVCPIVPVVIFKAGLKVELIDISPRTWCMDADMVLERLKSAPDRYAAVLFVHTYGVPDTFDSMFLEMKRQASQTLLIDDRCLCVPEVDAVQDIGADVVLFSTGYAKYVELGCGGYAFVKPGIRYTRSSLRFNPDDHQRMDAAMRTALQSKEPYRYEDSEWLDGSCPGRSFEAHKEMILARLPVVKVHKERLNRIYIQGIPPELCMAERFHHWRFNILVPRKERLLEAIFAEGLFASSHYSSLNGLFGVGADRHAQALHSRVVNLFNNERFTMEQAERMVEIVNQHVAHARP